MRRTRLLGAQAELWPDWRHFCVITNRTEDITLVEAEHRELPARWPWHGDYLNALNRIRALPAAT